MRPRTPLRPAASRRVHPLTVLAAAALLAAASAPAAAHPLTRPPSAVRHAAPVLRPAGGAGAAARRPAGAAGGYALPGPMVPPAAAAPGPAGPGADPAVPLPAGHETPAPGHGPLDPLVRLSAQRLLTADQVAAAKYLTGAPVDDPARNNDVLATAGAEAGALGDDPAGARRLLADQISAARLVERSLLADWAARPAAAPAVAPPLAALRGALDALDARLVGAWHDTAAVRAAPGCEIRLTAETRSVAGELGLDAAHTAALTRALADVCR